MDIVDMLGDHAAQRPNTPAVKDDDQTITYGQLCEVVGDVAGGLAASGVAAGDRVALLIPDSATWVALALGCLWLGATFVPLSFDDPPARLAHVLETTAPTLLVSGDPQQAGQRLPAHPPVAHPDALLARTSGAKADRTRDPTRDAYIIFTSGSTGAPKGIRTPEAAFRSAIISSARCLRLGPSTRALCVSPFHFDGSYGTLFATLVAGGTVVIPPREQLRYGKRFYRSIHEEGITHTGFTPSYLRLLLASPQLPALRTSTLQTLGLGGEECTASDIRRLWHALPDVRVFNRYGPTETTIEVTTHEIIPADLALRRIPIGVPHPGVTFHLIGDAGAVVSTTGETGELLIGGTQLMHGYWRDPDLTATVLQYHPHIGEMVFRTGDLAYRDTQGRYVWVGRRDDMLKRRGVRISLDEIATVLQRMPVVAGAACVADDSPDGPTISAFVVAGPEVDGSTLLDAARGYLPPTLLPDAVFVVTSLPLTPSRKVDRNRLSRLARQHRERRAAHRPGSALLPRPDAIPTLGPSGPCAR